MKRLILVLFLFVSFCAQSQIVTMQLNDKNDYELLSFRRGAHIIIPTWDNNGELFFMPDVKDNSKILDLLCLFDSLTSPGVYVPLAENLRFYNNVDKLNFIEFCELAGAVVQQNNIGDVIINNDLFMIFDLYPAIYEDVLTKAELIDRYTELINLGIIWPIPYPDETPIYTGCN